MKFSRIKYLSQLSPISLSNLLIRPQVLQWTNLHLKSDKQAIEAKDILNQQQPLPNAHKCSVPKTLASHEPHILCIYILQSHILVTN